MGDNHTPATSTFPNRSTCGSGMVLIGVPNGTAALSMPRQISITLRLLNKTTSPVAMPVTLVLPKSGIVVIGGGTSSKITPNAPDTLRADGTAVWLIDSVGVTRVIGDSTVIRTIVLKVGSPVQSARLTFQVPATTSTFVPPVAPDSAPAWFVDDSSWTSQLTLKRVADLAFLPGTSLSLKQAAIDSVGGAVIGGYHLRDDVEGVYYVFVPAALTDSAMVVALQTLTRQSGVKRASFHIRLKANGVRPKDGLGWRTLDWAFQPDASSQENWNYEDVAYPLGWGCQSGAVSTRVGVLEKYVAPGEYSNNARAFSLSISSPATLFDEVHGKNVANLLAAVGNDTLGITGALWSASIDIVTLGKTTATPLKELSPDYAIDSLVRLGAAVINMSIGPSRGSTPAADSAIQKTYADRIQTGLAAHAQPGGTLLVLAAGNDNENVSTRGVGMARAALPQGVLLVGASATRVATQRDRWGGASFVPTIDGGSNWGPLVDVYAPGQGVYAFTTSGGWGPQNGTSYAAPLVTGIAALLKEFDPTLTADSLRALILQGATAGGRNILNDPTKYLANAYESLRLGAKANGVPLCGNRLWVENQHAVRVQRGSGDQLLFTSPDTLGIILTTHGGRRIDFQARPSVRGSLTFTPGGWFSTTFTTPFVSSDWSGSAWSLLARNHDADSVVSPSFAQFGGGIGVSSASFSVTLSGRVLTSNMTIALISPDQTITTRRDAQVDSLGNFVQYVESPANKAAGNTYRTAEVKSVASPFGDRVLVLVSFIDFPYDSTTEWFPGVNAVPIGSEWSYEERAAVHHAASQRVEGWSIPWTGGTPQLLWTKSAASIAWIGLSEDAPPTGGEAAVGIGQKGTGPNGYSSCSVQYLNVLTGVSLRTIAAPQACGGVLDLGVLSAAPASLRGPVHP